jgi:predicted N-acetyltransferase YhbS
MKQGVGRKLISQVAQVAVKEGKPIKLYSMKGSEAFYKKVGFQAKKKRDDSREIYIADPRQLLRS